MITSKCIYCCRNAKNISVKIHIMLKYLYCKRKDRWDKNPMPFDIYDLYLSLIVTSICILKTYKIDMKEKRYVYGIT